MAGKEMKGTVKWLVQREDMAFLWMQMALITLSLQ